MSSSLGLAISTCKPLLPRSGRILDLRLSQASSPPAMKGVSDFLPQSINSVRQRHAVPAVSATTLTAASRSNLRRMDVESTLAFASNVHETIRLCIRLSHWHRERQRSLTGNELRSSPGDLLRGESCAGPSYHQSGSRRFAALLDEVRPVNLNVVLSILKLVRR